jgi:hypothetical protein
MVRTAADIEQDPRRGIPVDIERSDGYAARLQIA